MRSICTTIVATLALVGTSFAATINVPADQPTIAAAISVSVNGDVINIAAGTYNEHSLNPGGKAITIQGTLNGDGSLATTIDAQQAGGVFTIRSGEDVDTVIQNLVITGGSGTDLGYTAGGAIYCSFSNPTISGCTISDSTAYYGGGGIFCDFSDPIIKGCTITGNSSNGNGGGIYCSLSDPIITDCTITGNTAYSGGGMLIGNNSSPTITACAILGNTADNGGGIYCFNNSSPSLENVMVLSNSTPEVVLTGGSTLTVGNTQQELIAQLQTTIEAQQTAIEDLQQVITECCAGALCAGDENGDGEVDVLDLLLVIAAWGPCP